MEKMTKFRKYLCAASAVLAILLSCITADAAGPRITFTNKRTESTAFYVTKKVTCRNPGMKAPSEDSFLFYLRLNGMPASAQEYHLFKNGLEVFHYSGIQTTEKQENQVLIPFLTDENGAFHLKADETAEFENLTPNTFYEVAESPASHYTQTEPKGGMNAVGTLTEEGASVIFHNLYAPPFPGETDSAVLEIQKDIAFPYGYELPQTPDFTFQVLINGKVWVKNPLLLQKTFPKK